MTQKAFLNQLVTHQQIDAIQQFLDVLHRLNITYCVIGGLAVNAYVEPVVSLDVDMVIATAHQGALIAAVERIFTIKRFPYRVNLNHVASDIRI